jgi:hypothetical protein
MLSCDGVTVASLVMPQPRPHERNVVGSPCHDPLAARREPGIVAPSAVDGPSARFRRNLAVVIGIDVYGEGIPQLRSAVADAKAIAEVLRRDHGFETWCLFDDHAQLPQLLTLLREQLPGSLGPEDRLLFYFAGHGIAVDGDGGPAGYLIPARARRSECGGFLPMNVLHGELVRLPVRHALVILDCCFAGTFRWSSLRDIEPEARKIHRERYDRYIESAAWQVLTSASSDQLALDLLANDRGEGAGPHSPFALALLGGLAGAADYTQDNMITADELAMYVRECVTTAAESVGRRQVPQLFPLDRHDCGQFVFQVPNRTLELAPAPALDEDASPYLGLQSFHEEDRALFFGRDAATQRLVEAVDARQLTVVVGPSGSGKSSLVHAGLVPALRERGWTVLPTQRPGREPLTALDAWTRALGAAPTSGDPVASWVAAVAARSSAQPDQCWLVVVDQFEELLTHRTAEPDRAAFLDALASALRAAPLFRLVVTVRSDAEPQFHDTSLKSWWTVARVAVPAMTRDELRQIIEKPATAAVLHFEPSRLVERLIDDVALVPAPLPLLSFALSELYRCCWTRWQDGVRDRGLRAHDYDEMGSVARALTQRATAVHDKLMDEDAAYAITIRNVFIRMVAIVGGEIARRRVPRDELVYEDPEENRRVADVLQRFHEARLISQGTEKLRDGGTRHSGTGAYAEPTHDELVRGWTKVSQWLDEVDATPGMRTLPALGDAVRSWRSHEHDDIYLWNDPRVDLLNKLGGDRRFVFNADEKRFVDHSVRRLRRRRARVIGGLLTVILLLAIIAATAISVASAQEQELEGDALRTNAYAAHALAGAVAFHLREQMDAVVATAANPAVTRLFDAVDDETLQQLRIGTPFESISLFDRAGKMISHSPSVASRTIGENYAWREYFRGAQRLGEAGLRAGYISRAFRSEADKLYKFGIAAPVYDSGAWVGVLMATIGTDFAFGRKHLDDSSDAGRMAVVVTPRDRSRATTEGEGEYVVMLHEGLAHGAEVVIESPRLRELRVTRTDRKQLRWVDPEPITDDAHRDPVPGFAGRWLSGFAPVGDTGFVVIVQTRYDAAVEPNARLSRSFARRAGAVILVCIVVFGAILGIRWGYLVLRRSARAPATG